MTEFINKAVAIANAQWIFFGSQTRDLTGNTTHKGHQEGDDGYYQRVGEYWLEGTNTHGLDGRSHEHPWSAAFISWVMREAGAGTRFRYSTQHSVYISQGIRDFSNQRDSAGYWTERLIAIAPKVGDIVCWAREEGVDYDHQKQGDYAGHCDLVVETSADHITIIGGNVGNSVTQRPIPIGADGKLTTMTISGENLFALMVCRM